MKLQRLLFYSCIFLLAVLFLNGVTVLSKLNIGISDSEPSPESGPGENISYTEDNELNYPENEQNYPNNEPKPSVQSVKPVNLLILGVDEEGVRSDVILLANYSPNDGKVNFLSVARDTRVRIRNRFEKINALIGIGGEKLVVKAMEQLTGLKVDYYLTLNFKGFRKIIDTLDGVEFNVPFNMDYDDPDQNLHIHLRKGKQILNGINAEHLVRYRKGNRPGEGYIDGDIGRINMQQDFIKALVQQKIRLKYLTKADDIYMILKKSMKTNIEMGDINRYLKDLRKINYEEVKAYTVPGDSAYIDHLWYFICDKTKTKQLINKNFFK
ncbi:MAG: cell envelope-related transcriptional attenuator [Clostridiales bacterium]|jgi:LCP family protein required for cell wall assembly|nr:cell envelope-related transcriptional attenuator [Clostridiales bacterium]